LSLTPIDIGNKEFRQGLRGYRCEEVDRFLADVSKEFELIYAENFDLREKAERLESQLAHYQQLENTLHQTMILAQQTADAVKDNARREAELILREAEQEKARQLSEARAKWEEIQEEIEELRRRRELIRTQLKSFLMAQLELTETFANEAPGAAARVVGEAS